MKARILQIVLGIAMFFCSTPFGFATQASAGEVRAEFFCGGEEVKAAGDEFAAGVDLENESGRLVKAVFNDAGLVQFADCECDGESGVDGEKEVKRETKRRISLLKFYSHNCFTCSLSAKSQSKGVAKHPGNQDAGQERTKVIRCLQLAALVC